MYYDNCTYQRENRIYRRELLRESRRVNGRVVKRTVANITRWPEPVKQAIRSALSSGSSESTLTGLLGESTSSPVVQGKSVGAIAAVLAVAERLGITDALGNDRQGKLALFQVAARVIDQGSRLSAVRMARSHAAAELIGLSGFDEDDLYENLSWLSGRQQAVEDALFNARYPDGQAPPLFLYDVTSSYFEGERNELAAFGYNRDGKKGKRQMVVGLLTDHEGCPVSVEVFPGNTSDPVTVPCQVDKLRDRFRGKELTLVGDRGMLKGPQQTQLSEIGMRYLTAITKAQINTLLNQGVIQMELFDEGIAEVSEQGSSVRYILRRNPVQAARMKARRADQLASWMKSLDSSNEYLKEHPKAAAGTQVRRLTARAKRLKLSEWVHIEVDGRSLSAEIDEEARAEAAKLDGCYVLRTDLPKAAAESAEIDARYHDLSSVEWAFRTSKTAHLEMRPIHLRKEERTRAHAFVVMLAYMIVHHLAGLWSAFDMTVEEALAQLGQLCCLELSLPDGPVLRELPEPRPEVARLLEAADVQLPALLSPSPPGVDTKVKLNKRRK